GIRLARAGYDTRILDSTTWEEAPSRLGDWFRQRTRWLKGYAQTFLVHTVDPAALLRELGLRRSVLMTAVVGGQVATTFLLPVALALLQAWSWLRWPLTDPARPWTACLLPLSAALAAFQLVLIAAPMLAVRLRGLRGLAPWALAFPAYWLLAGLAAWRALAHLALAPHLWEKTPHGVPARRPGGALRLPSGSWEALVLGAGVALGLLLLKPGLDVGLGRAPRHCYRNLTLSESEAACRIRIEEDWSGRGGLSLDLRLPAAPVSAIEVELSVRDGEAFGRRVSGNWAGGERVRLDLPFDARWRGARWESPLSAWALRRTRAVTVRVRGAGGLSDPRRVRGRFDVVHLAAGPVLPAAPLRLLAPEAPPSLPQGARLEVRFDLEPRTLNPFDPDEIDVWLHVRSPAGVEKRVPAFFTQDYRRGPSHARGFLTPVGPPHWAARYALRESGRHSWWLTARDGKGRAARTAERALRVAARPRSAVLPALPIRPDGRHFRDARGRFFYPLGLNVAWPRDRRAEEMGGFRPPSDRDDTKVFDEAFAEMRRTGMNLARVWMGPWWGGLEWNVEWPGFHGLGVYNLENAWRLDYVLAQAERHGILVDLLLEPHGPFLSEWDSQWEHNPYNAKNGGPLASAEQVFSDPRALALFKRKYRYILARYSAFDSVFAWELWNEADVISGNTEDLIRWIDRMTPHLAGLDPLRRPAGLTLWWRARDRHGAVPRSLIMRAKGLGWVGFQAYHAGDGAVEVLSQRSEILSREPLPVLATEGGGLSQGLAPKPMAHDIHDLLWSAWVRPLAGAPWSWWWGFVVERGVGRFHRAFSEFIAGEDLGRESWSFSDPAVSSLRAPGLRCRARSAAASAFLWVYYAPVSDLAIPQGFGADPADLRAVVNGMYRRRVPPGFDPLRNGDPGLLFGPAADAKVRLPALAPGLYRVEFWDTWGGGRVGSATLRVGGSETWLPLPSIRRDLAVKLKRLPGRVLKS
ncbi:MAG: hypothetical protein HY554_09895, partial [Elusimicrobia bacterium]|nr:hypothetical protein [Elusimicrobiota bacterium]